MKPKAFIHIGLQKTASTYFQQKIWPQVPDLNYLSRPYTQENRAFNALQYADSTLYDPDLVRAELEAVQASNPERPLLISDELLSGFAFYGVINRSLIAERLAQVLPHAEVILFLRGQIGLVESLYNQFVKTGWYARRLDESFLCGEGRGLSYEAWQNDMDSWCIDNRDFRHTGVFSARHFLYGPVVNLYASLFPKVHIVLYEELLHSPDSCFERLTQILDRPVEAPHLQPDAMTNPRIRSASLRTRLIDNRIAKAFPDRKLPSWLQLMAKFALTAASQSQSEQQRREFVVRTLDSVGVFSDNRKLDSQRALGMSDYARDYFEPFLEG